MWARQESQILRREGPAALERYIGSFEMDPGVQNYIFDAAGHDVLGRAADPAGHPDGGGHAGLAAWKASRGQGRAHHRGARHRRPRRVARGRRRLAEPVGAEPIAVRVSLARVLRQRHRRRGGRPCGRGPRRRGGVLLRARASHCDADGAAAAGGAQHREPAAADARGRQRARAARRAGGSGP